MQKLNNTWDIIWSTDAIVGAFIWEWQAQGMYDKFPERWGQRAPGARTNDAKTGYRASGGNGPVTADRKIQPIFAQLKAAHSPVHTAATEVAAAEGKCVVPLQNRYSFTDLGELTCRWQALAGDKELAKRRKPHRRQTPLLGGRLVPRGSRHGHPASGVHPSRRAERVRDEVARQELGRFLGGTCQGNARWLGSASKRWQPWGMRQRTPRLPSPGPPPPNGPVARPAPPG